MTNVPMAYNYVALLVMLAEINFCAARLHLSIALPVHEMDVPGSFICHPKLIGVSGRIDTADYTFSFGASGRLRYIVKLNQREGLSLAGYQDKLSRMKWTIGTNEAYRIARKALESIEVDVSRLEEQHASVCEQRSFYSQRDGKRQLVPLPLFDVKWGDDEMPSVAVVVSGVSGEVLSVRQEDDSYSRRPSKLIKDLDKLLAIPDSEFLKYSPEQRSNLVAEFAAVQYPHATNQGLNHNGGTKGPPVESNFPGQTNAPPLLLIRTATNLPTAPALSPYNSRLPRLTPQPTHSSFNQAIMVSSRAKQELRNSKDTFNGHQETAADACDKAIQELEAVTLSRVADRSVSPRPLPKSVLNPNFGTQPGHPSFRQAIMALRRAKLELQHSKDTFNGHQKPAIDACDKAIQELETVVRTSGSPPSWSPQFTPPPSAKASSP